MSQIINLTNTACQNWMKTLSVYAELKANKHLTSFSMNYLYFWDLPTTSQFRTLWGGTLWAQLKAAASFEAWAWSRLSFKLVPNLMHLQTICHQYNAIVYKCHSHAEKETDKKTGPKTEPWGTSQSCLTWRMINCLQWKTRFYGNCSSWASIVLYLWYPPNAWGSPLKLHDIQSQMPHWGLKVLKSNNLQHTLLK